MVDNERGGSVPRRRRGFTVAVSPFNPVKLELAVILVVGLLLLIVHGRLVDGALAQLGLLLAYGVGAMLWLLWRTRRVLTGGQRPDNLQD